MDNVGIEELACFLTGLDYDKIDADETVIEAELVKKFNINLEDFGNVVRALLPLIDVGSSGLTKKTYKGFANRLGQSWFVKIEV